MLSPEIFMMKKDTLLLLPPNGLEFLLLSNQTRELLGHHLVGYYLIDFILWVKKTELHGA